MKRLFEITLASILLLILLPFIFLLSLYLLGRFKSSPFFLQKRIGLKGRPFKLIKFRTLPDSEQIPPVDLQFLRDTGMDEFPQLLNILAGQMSFIGPRPLLPEYLGYYTEAQFERHNVKPGILGLAQLKGGNALPWRHRLRWDQCYVRNQSNGLDWYIFQASLFRWRRIDAGLHSSPFNGAN